MHNLFDDAIEAIYSAAPDPSRWPMTLQAMADVFGDIGAVLVFERDDGGFGAIASSSLDGLLRDYANGFDGQDLRAMRGRERGVYLGRDAVTDLDVVTTEEMESHPFYELLARHGLKYFVGAPVSPDSRIAVSIAIQRSPHKAPYSPEEIEVFSRLSRHAETSLRLSIRLLDAELSNLGLCDALGRLNIGVFALDSLGRLVFSNPAGDRLLGDGITLVDGHLRVASSAARGDIEGAIAAILNGESRTPTKVPSPVLIDRARSERPLVAYVLPLGTVLTPADRFLTHARALVLAIDPEAGTLPDPAVVRDVLGLTLGEARVASLVGSGLAPRQAAEKLGITEETARTALKRIFSKVGVSRQSELTALLTKLVLR